MASRNRSLDVGGTRGVSAALVTALLLALSASFTASGCGLVTTGLSADTGGSGPAEPCSSAEQCDDGDACTIDECTGDGVCAHAAADDGPAPGAQQIVGDCKTIQCAGGKTIEQADDGDVPDDAEECTTDLCQAGEAIHAPVNDGEACLAAMGEAGSCVGGACEVSCSETKPCPDPGPCATVACDAATGTCFKSPLADGIPTPGAPQPAGDCHVRICKDGADFDKVDDSDVPLTQTDCDIEVCDAGVPSNPPKNLDNTCSTSPVGAGFCDGAGTCVECNVAKQCQAPSGPCETATCDNHVCGLPFVQAGTALGPNQQIAGDCKQKQCNGAGGVIDVIDDNDKPADGKVCTTDVCTAGVPSNPPVPAGTDCGAPYVCNATGNCGCQSNGDCSAPNTCMSGVCACNPSTCGGLGKTCGLVSDGCFNPNLNCNTNSQNGQETDIDCGGPVAACATRCAQGKKCSMTSDCAANLTCVDGVCCTTTCSGLCQACSVAKKGQGVDGVCGSIAVGLDPDNECATQAASTCGTTGVCNGSGACQTYAAGTQCVAQTCANGVQSNADTCNASSMCQDNGTTSCSPYICGATSCKTSCQSGSDCVAGYTCTNSVCTNALLANGQPCTMASQCTSNSCRDGVCCASACMGFCRACTAAKKGYGSDGTCGDIAAGLDPDNECPAPGDGGNSCDGSGNCN